MWRAFQTADAESVEDELRVDRPFAARCWFTSSTTRAAKSPRTVPHELAGTQSPTAAGAVAGVAANERASVATSAAVTPGLRIQARPRQQPSATRHPFGGIAARARSDHEPNDRHATLARRCRRRRT
jgi:hypothetical protein